MKLRKQKKLRRMEKKLGKEKKLRIKNKLGKEKKLRMENKLGKQKKKLRMRSSLGWGRSE
ncbi:unnamed protein product, partial [Sphenostylis stenocarpa]